MNYRPRRSRFSRDQWLVQRDRFQIDEEVPPPVDEAVVPIGQTIHNLLTSIGLGGESTQRKLMDQWEVVAGQPLCRHVRPGPIKDGTLTIYVTNSTLLSELKRFQGSALLDNVQKVVGGEIKRLWFLMDPDGRPTRTDGKAK